MFNSRWIRDVATASMMLLGALASLPGCGEEQSIVSQSGFERLTIAGAWCWFADPRAIYYEGQYRRTYGGWVSPNGTIRFGTYDHDNGQLRRMSLHEKLNQDDHANPALLLLQDGRMVVFYSGHAGPQMRYRIMEEPENIDSFGPERTVVPYEPSLEYEYTYPNPVRLTAENNRIYLFWRGNVNEPVFATSEDDALTFGPVRRLMTSSDKVPYVKVHGDGERRIHFAFTESHPRYDEFNSVYYASYVDGKFVRADGSTIRDMAQLPFNVEEGDLVYDAKKTGERAWVWDVAADVNGSPVIVYARFPSETDHRYHYARWNGSAWKDYELTAAGGAFPDTPANVEEPEPHYSGGIVIDHENPSVVYLSRPIRGVFEIERWTTPDFGASWKVEAVTKASIKDNVRPYVIRDYPAGKKPSVMWMQKDRYETYTQFQGSILMDIDESASLGGLDFGVEF